MFHRSMFSLCVDIYTRMTVQRLIVCQSYDFHQDILSLWLCTYYQMDVGENMTLNKVSSTCKLSHHRLGLEGLFNV